MATSKVIYQGGLRTRSVHLLAGEIILTDAPVDNNAGEVKPFPQQIC